MKLLYCRITTSLWSTLQWTILLWTILLWTSTLQGQQLDIAITQHTEEEFTIQLFDQHPFPISLAEALFKARNSDLAADHPRLTVSGDFTGNRIRELALFGDLSYTPNMNPHFTNTVVKIFRSTGIKMQPEGTWYNDTDSLLRLDDVDFSVAGDYNSDGLDDIALFYNDPDSENQIIYVLESTGTGFSAPKIYFSTPRNEFNFTAIDFACAGDFNGNDKPDIAVFYNYTGDEPSTQQSIFLFESDNTGESIKSGDSDETDESNELSLSGISDESDESGESNESNESTLRLEGAIYTGTKSEIDFSDIRFALAEDYDGDGYTDIAILRETPPGQDHELLVFKGSEAENPGSEAGDRGSEARDTGSEAGDRGSEAGDTGSEAGSLIPENYLSTPQEELDFSHITHAAAGRFTIEPAPGLLLLSKDPATGNQDVIVLEGRKENFLAPAWITDSPLSQVPFEEIASLHSGRFIHLAVAYATTWKDDHQGAISFTFDDGALGAFEYGAPALEEAHLTGTFYVFTDTSIEYDSPVAGGELMQLYHEKGFEIASHTYNHSNLGLITTEDPDSLSAVLNTSIQELNQRFSQHTISLSIPFGSFRWPTLDSISKYFLTARSSQFGFNLSAPYDYYALRSWPILSTTTPEYVDKLVSKAESYGTYLPLMYHDMLDESFDEETQIYSYSLSKFKECIRLCKERDVWIDTHARVYKYMREREALQIEEYIPTNENDAFLLVLRNPLPDSIFDVELTLHIGVPAGWDKHAAVYVEDSLWKIPILDSPSGKYIQFNQLPLDGTRIELAEWTPNGLDAKATQETASSLTLSAFPNPFHRECSITIEGSISEPAQLILMDMQGSILRTLETKGQKHITISEEGLPPGMYIVGLLGSQGDLAYIKLLKQ